MATIRCGTIAFTNIAAVLFDKDGTLAASAAYLHSLAQRRARLIDAKIPGVQEPLLLAFGIENQRLNPEGLIAVGTRQESCIAAAVYVAETGRGWVEARSIAQSAFVEADRDTVSKAERTPLTSGALTLLQALNRADVKIGIISSDSLENIQSFVACYELQPYVQTLKGVTATLQKPNPELLWQACQELEVNPKTALVIGDADSDCQMARAAGAAGFVGVIGYWEMPIALKAADAIVHQLDQIEVIT